MAYTIDQTSKLPTPTYGFAAYAAVYVLLQISRPHHLTAHAVSRHHRPLIVQLLALLRGGQAHATFDQAIKDFPVNHYATVPSGLVHSAWQILEHLRITQQDILNFSAPPTGGYKHIAWPDDYWPRSPAPPSPGAWEQTIASIRHDQQKFEALLLKPGVDPYKPFLWGDGQNLLREALLIADHNAYHLGELVGLRRILGIWQ